VEIKSNGKQVYPLGKNAIGQIIYSMDGHVAAQLARRGRKRFDSEDWKDASEAEGARAWKEYFGYFGHVFYRPSSGCRDPPRRGLMVSQPAVRIVWQRAKAQPSEQSGQ
jgi:hypothetical protein